MASDRVVRRGRTVLVRFPDLFGVRPHLRLSWHRPRLDGLGAWIGRVDPTDSIVTVGLVVVTVDLYLPEICKENPNA